MKRPQVASAPTNLLSFQNRIRGAVGTSRSRTFDKNHKDTALRNRIRISRIIAESRTVLGASEYEFFLEWAGSYTKAQAPSLERARYQLDELGTYSSKPPLKLELEIAAACIRLARNLELIEEFRRFANEVEDAFWKTDSRKIKQQLEAIEEAFGQSIWLIEANIAFRQLFEGLESQKQYAQGIRSKARSGIAPYIAFYLSVKNEPTVTSARFAQSTESRLAKTNIPQSAKIYLNQRLAENWPATENGFSSILHVEQTTSPVDLYEATIAVAQVLVANGCSSTVKTALCNGLRKLVDAEDYRISKLLLLLEGDRSSISRLPAAPYEASDALLAGDPGSCWSKLQPRLRNSFVSVNDLVLASLATGRKGRTNRASNIVAMIDRLSTIYRKEDDFEQAANETLRLCHNLHFLPSLKSIRRICELECFPKTIVAPHLLIRMLNSRELDVRDLANGFETADPKLLDQLDGCQSSTASQIITALANSRSIDERAKLEDHLRTAVSAFANLREQNNEQYVDQLRSLAVGSDLPRHVRISISLQLISHLIGEGRLDLAAELAAQEYVVEPSVARTLPISAMIGTDGWRTLRPYSKNISVPIILDLRWRQTSDDRVATYRRFSTQQFLLKNGVERPSQLRTIADQFPKRELVYFLDQVCAYSVLDMLPSFTSSVELQNERKHICQFLAELDPANITKYQDEILEIANRQIVQSGLEILDNSRIHVDVDGITRWAKRELEESFFRYKALVGAGIGIAENFDDVLKKLLRGSESQQYMQLPKSEADEILITVVTQLLNGFLLDSSYGLDSYLSQRIRHGSLMNYLRSPVEQAHLVTQKSAQTSNYEPNSFWVGKLRSCMIGSSDELQAAFRTFSRTFDGQVLELKDKYLNVVSKEKPDGLFDLEITASAFYLLRSLVQEIATVEQFVPVCIRFFWGLLDPSLKAARHFLQGEIKKKFSVIFEQLKSEAFALVDFDSPAFAELSMQIGDASASVQSELDKIAGWLERQEILESKSRYTLRQAFEIAVESVLSAHKTFKPDLSLDIISDVQVGAPEIIVLADTIRLLLGNVDAHAGTKHSPKVHVQAVVKGDAETLTIRCDSEVKRGVRTPAVEARLSGIRDQISDGSYLHGLRSEGGTGLKRLARLVGRSQNSKLDFGFSDEESFFVELTFVLFTFGGAA